MKKNSFIKCIAVGLAATLTLAGCDSGGGGPVADGSSGSGGGGGVSGTSSSGTGTGMGLTGADTPGGGSGGGAGGGSGSGGTNAPTTTPTTTDGGTTPTPTPEDNFRRDVGTAPKSQVLSQTNPTQMVVLGTRVYFIRGFNNATGDAPRLVSAPILGTGASRTLGPATVVGLQGGSPLGTNELIFPFGLTTNGTDLFLSVGCNPSSGGFGNGAIYKVSNLTEVSGSMTGRYESLTALAVPLPTNPSFMFTETVGGTEYVYWSQYATAAGGGSVRRVPTAGGLTQDVAVGLEVPAGIDSDGENLVIAVLGANQILRTSLTPGGPLSTVALTPLEPAPGINRPFDVEYDGVSGFFITQGMSIATGGFGPIADGLPIRYLPSSSLVSKPVVASVIQGRGLEATDLGGGKIGILYADGLTTNTGRLMRAVVDTASSTPAIPLQISSTNLEVPFETAILDVTFPIFLTTVNFSSGLSNGRIDLFRP